jgi:hypothetical protein
MRGAHETHRDTLNDTHSLNARDTRDALPITPTDSTVKREHGKYLIWRQKAACSTGQPTQFGR